MKNILKTVVLIAASALWLAGCKKDEVRNYYKGGTPPVLTASRTNIPLSPTTVDDEAVKFNWTNPNYMFATGISSHDVQYALEFDINNQFNSNRKYVASISKELSKAFKVGEFNSILANQMMLTLDQNATIYARVVSSLRFESSVNAQLPSNTITITTRPFSPPPTVEPPTAETLWATGDAFNSGWANPLPAPFDVNQRIAKVTNTLYEGVLFFRGGGGYKLIQEQGNWGTQYHRIDGDAFGGRFEKADAEPGFIGPSTPGNYKVSINFQTGRFTVTPQ
ncbi:MAG TPA: SusE domain-containing protein [Phnomibacter sp.]|nr:SusE domain-containing protein [Phnomibacter sp.]